LAMNSAAEMYERLQRRLGRVLPEIELRSAAELAAEVEELKKARNAAVVAHNYMEPALFYSVADMTGDSLDLSRRIRDLRQKAVVFCGVRFMAESARILAPEKRILLPVERAGCSLAESITAADVRRLREVVPGAPVVSYVNTYAEVKAESDVCCTSSNAAQVLRMMRAEGADRIIFVPDEYLARNTAAELGWEFVLVERTEEGEVSLSADASPPVVIGWPGRCEVHERFSVRDIDNSRRQFPDVTVLAHPECPPEVVQAADFSGSTNAMIRYVDEHRPRRILLLTECAMADNVQAAHPELEVVRLCSLRCTHMNEITLGRVKWALENMEYEIQVDGGTAEAARRALQRMVRTAPRT